jgi:mono/diheme cytochrome c family protein
MLRPTPVLAAALLALAGAFALTVGLPAQPAAWAPAFTAPQAARGAAVYAANCEMCHLKTLLGGDIAPPVAGPGFLARWNQRDVAALLRYIQVQMPLHSPGGLRPQQNADVLAYLLEKSGVAAGTKELTPPADLARPAPAAVADTALTPGDDRSRGRYYTDDQAERGRLAFNRNCGFCHSAGPGRGFGGTFLQRESGGVRVWPTVYYFFKKLEAMPAYDTAAISQQSRADIAAYILKQNGYPAGRQALTPDYAVMKTLTLDEPGFERIFNGKDFTGLRVALRPNCGGPPDGCTQTDPGTVFTAADDELRCDCTIHGLVYTAKKYLYFDLRFDYRWDRPADWEGPPWLFQPSNGTLIFTQSTDLWPVSIEIEGHERDLGEAVGVYTPIEKTYDHAAVRAVQRPIGEWSSIRIVSARDGTVKSYVNGVLAGTVTRHGFAALGGGHIAFQSQGWKIRWRNIRIKSDDGAAK